MKKIIGLLGLALFALPMLASAATIQVSMVDNYFNSKNITISPGDTVVWTNNGNMPHTVAADNGSFISGNLVFGQSYSRTFNTAGTFPYYCTYHGGIGGIGMAGTITVATPAPPPPPPVAMPTTYTSPSTQDNTLAAQAQALLQQVAQLQAQLSAQQGGNSSVVNTNVQATNNSAAAGPNSCPNIGRILKKGMSGDDVTRLQTFLAKDPSIYPEGIVSGYFGALTELAVQKWQVKNNIISSGSPATTGWGQVGPRTAAAIALLCSGGGGSNTGGSTSPVGGYIQVSPISGNAPLNVNVVATVNSTLSCAGAIYSLNWGDGTNPMTIPVSANNCQQISQTYQHTYTGGGTYQITLSAGSHQTGATVTVYGNSTTPSPSPTPTGTGETFNASPTSGTAPLSVTFTGTVNGNDAGWCANGCSDILTFGDGQQGAVPLPTSKTGAQQYSLQHSYTTAGTYTATLFQGTSGSGRPTVGTPISITVNAAPVITYNQPTATPGVGGNPLVVSLGFDIVQCGNYSISWGDTGNAVPGQGQCGGSGNVTKNETHTYSSPGSYTIVLTRGSQTNTVGITISN